MPSYPSQLPMPVQTGYGLQHVSPFMRSDMQSGRARNRRMFTSVPSQVSVQWLFTNEWEAPLFEGWFRDDLGAKDGENWFTMTLQTPLGLQPYECRFIDMYRGPTLVAFNKWQISASIEIRERPIVAEYEATIMPSDIILADIFDRTMNEWWPEA